MKNFIKKAASAVGFDTKSARGWVVGFGTSLALLVCLTTVSFAQPLISPPAINLDGQEVADAVGLELSQYIYPLLGLAIAFMGLRFVWRKMYAGGK